METNIIHCVQKIEKITPGQIKYAFEMLNFFPVIFSQIENVFPGLKGNREIGHMHGNKYHSLCSDEQKITPGQIKYVF